MKAYLKIYSISLFLIAILVTGCQTETPIQPVAESNLSSKTLKANIESLLKDIRLEDKTKTNQLLAALNDLSHLSAKQGYHLKSKTSGVYENDNYETESFYQDGRYKSKAVYKSYFTETNFNLADNSVVFYDSVSDVGMKMDNYIKSNDELDTLGAMGNFSMPKADSQITALKLQKFQDKACLFLEYKDAQGFFQRQMYIDLETGFVLSQLDYFQDFSKASITTELIELTFGPPDQKLFQYGFDAKKIKRSSDCETG